MPVWAIVIIVVLMIAVLVNEWRTRKKPIRRTESGGSTEGSSWQSRSDGFGDPGSFGG